MRRFLVWATTLIPVAAVLAANPAVVAVQDPWLRTSVQFDRAAMTTEPSSAVALARGSAFRLSVAVEIDAGYHINAHEGLRDFQIPTVLTPQPAAGIRWGDVRYPPGQPFTPAWARREHLSVYAGRVPLVLGGTVADDAPLGPMALRLRLDFQGCNETSCFQPASRELTAAVRIVAAAPPAPAIEPRPVWAGTATPALPPQNIEFEGAADLGAAFERSFFLYLAALFVGGLLLNLTPCVFPLIPVTLTVFARQGESRPLKVLPLAALYVLGLAATFTVVGVIAALAGRSLGLVLEQPVGVLAVVAILAAMMASTFGAFEIQLPSGLMGRLSARRGYLGAAFMGMVMGAIAAPCVGPFLLALITFVATKRSVAFGAVSFFVTGLGIGLPYLFLGMFTSLINRVPRGGGWLVWTKRLLGLTLAGLILYYVERFIDREFFWPLVLALFVFAAVYLGLLEGWERRPFSRRFWTVRMATALVLVATGLGVYGYATALRPQVAWQPWTPDALQEAQAAERPVLLYFGADWCIECKAWHAGVFADPAVVRESDRFVRLYVDVTRLEEGPKKEFARQFKAVNPPVVILIGRNGQVLFAYRNPPDAAHFADAMRRISQNHLRSRPET